MNDAFDPIKGLQAELHEAALREVRLAHLIEYYAGLPTSMWVNVELSEFIELARAGFEAKKAEFDALMNGVPFTNIQWMFEDATDELMGDTDEYSEEA